MLKTLTVAILLGLTSGRPSEPSGQEINILESKDLIYIHQEFPNIKDSYVTQLEEMPDLQFPFESLLRNKRDLETRVNDLIEKIVATLNYVLVDPLENLLSLVSYSVIELVEGIFGLVANILNPVLNLLTDVLDPILKPFRSLLDPILDPVNILLKNILTALHLPLDLSGLLTGNAKALLLSNAGSNTTDSSNSSSEEAESSDSPEETLSDPTAMTPDLSQKRRRRATSPFPVSNLVTSSRDRRQSIDPSFSSALGSIISVPLMILRNILSALKNVIVSPLKLILSPTLSLLRIPADLISLPFDLIDSILSDVASPITGIIKRITGPTEYLSVGLIDFGLASAKQVVRLVRAVLSMPSTLANEVLESTTISSRRRRDAVSAMSAGPLNVFLSLLSGPLKTLFSYLPSLLAYFNISYPTLQEAARVLFSNAANRFLVTAYNVTKNIILPGVDDLLQSIVGSEYIPDYLNSAITQFHSIYKLLRMMGYLRPS